MANWRQGKYVPVNKQKYIGKLDAIEYRSGWELTMMRHLDRDPSVVRWGSEPGAVPYISPKDSRVHRYYPDFYIEQQRPDGSIRKMLVEVKPHNQTAPPTVAEKTKSGRQSKRFVYETVTYAVNQAKWDAARELCERNGWEFIILSEKGALK